MRRWYDSDNLSYTSNDGYEVWLHDGYQWLYSPNHYLIGLIHCHEIHNNANSREEYHSYMLYKCERIITVYEDTILKPFRKIREAHKNEVTHAKALLNTEYGISTQLRRMTDVEEA